VASIKANVVIVVFIEKPHVVFTRGFYENITQVYCLGTFFALGLAGVLGATAFFTAGARLAFGAGSTGAVASTLTWSPTGAGSLTLTTGGGSTL
jgi:hypothetical protein